MGNIMITKMTGQTAVAASLRAARLRAFAELGGTGLGLGTTGASVVPAVSVLGHTDLCVTGGRNVEGTSVETGLSRDWAESFGTSRPMRDERPTQAPKAAVAAAKHGGYAQVIGAGATQKQNEQQIEQAKAAFVGAEAIRMRAFRGPEPWRERT
ncbi:hypothetical protein [Streptomyces rubellomurinus]|uniref:Uncharacterized protein n=1 Tax=Streptomyces sp. Y1 TaxID=3238634 RepID=A0AB39TJ58_9ACTN|nr:hypothetical protein VM98_20845 [Streptomyces rubellomurinus subsp. indigoferus]